MIANKKAVPTAVLMAMLVFVIVIFASPSHVSAWEVSITADACAAPGDTVTVSVMAYNVTSAVPDIAAACYNIEFNASVVNVTGVATGSGNALPVKDWNFIASDTVRILAMDPDTEHTGDVNIANVTFKAVGGAGSICTLEVTDAQFTDYNLNSITPDAINNGSFRILAGWNVSITTEAGAAPGTTITVPVMAYNVTSAVPDIAAACYNIEFNASVVNVTDVATGSVNALFVQNWNFIPPDTVRILAGDTLAGHTGNVNLANITFITQGPERSTSPLNIWDASYLDFDVNWITPDSMNNGTFIVWDVTPPAVMGHINRDTILNDNDRARPAGWNESQINVTVTETPGAIQSVTIDLSEIGHGVQDMSPPDGDIYSYAVTGVSDAYYGTHNLTINATDDWSLSPNSNSKNITITVLVRGDVYPAGGDGIINIQDSFYMAKFSVYKVPQPDSFVADVFPATGNGAIDLQDWFYMAKFLVGKEPAP